MEGQEAGMCVSLICRYSSMMFRGKPLYNATHASMFTFRLLLPLSSWTYRIRSFCVIGHCRFLFLLYFISSYSNLREDYLGDRLSTGCVSGVRGLADGAFNLDKTFTIYTTIWGEELVFYTQCRYINITSSRFRRTLNR